jgi:hypothetical protein
MMVPSALVDMVWQRHQLDTANYFEDCSYLCIPGGYLHRHCIAVKQEAYSVESKAGDNSTCPLMSAYENTLQLYEETFEVAPESVIWSRWLAAASVAVAVGVAIPLGEIASASSEVAATEEQLVAELLWVGEVVRAELPVKQARCPGKSEPINQIRFYPHSYSFVPTAEQEQHRLELVVREYVRFLMLVMKYHHGEVTDLEGGDPTKSAHFQVTPSKLVDELWHAHILRSPAYFQFCLQHAPGGRYVHHEPHFDKPHNYHEPGFAETVKAYTAQFGCPPRDVWGGAGRERR